MWSFIVRQRRSVNRELRASPMTSSGHDRHRIEFAQSRLDGRTAIRRIFFVRSSRGLIGEAEAKEGEDVNVGHLDGLEDFSSRQTVEMPEPAQDSSRRQRHDHSDPFNRYVLHHTVFELMLYDIDHPPRRHQFFERPGSACLLLIRTANIYIAGKHDVRGRVRPGRCPCTMELTTATNPRGPGSRGRVSRSCKLRPT